MLRLKPIRRVRRRGPSRDALRIADVAFWLALLFAVALGVGPVARGMPLLIAAFVPGLTAQASAPSTLHLDLPETHPPLGPPPPLRLGYDGKPAIAIVIDDLGGDVVHTRRAIALPPQVALAFLPEPHDTPVLARAAAQRGHEVLAHVPMQAMGTTRLGALALTVDLAPAEIVRRLDRSLARVPGFAGVNNHEGSRFTADRAALDPVMADLAARHVFFLDSRTTADTQAIPAARAHGVETASRDVFLDDVVTIDAVDAQLRALEARARLQGVAVAIGHPHDITLDAVRYWAAYQRDFELVTLKQAIRKKTEAELKSETRLSGGVATE